MIRSLSETLRAIGDMAARIIAAKRDRGPVATVEDLIAFLHTRASFVAQTSLYGYLKTRMGTKYVALFQDDVYVSAVNTAKWPIFASCLADLTIFAVAVVADEAGLNAAEAAALAEHCYTQAVHATFEAEVLDTVGMDRIEAFAQRTRLCDWRQARDGENAFGRSPDDLVVHAPVIEAFKELDAEIVRNSMRFRWGGVRRECRRRLDAAAVGAAWRTMTPPQ